MPKQDPRRPRAFLARFYLAFYQIFVVRMGGVKQRLTTAFNRFLTRFHLEKVARGLLRAYYFLRNLSFVKRIFFYYFLITLVGTLLLFSNAAHREPVSFVDALFTAASAFSDTGLAPRVTASTWTVFGQAVIAGLILVGGIGWFALKVYFLNILFGRPISFNSRDVISAERGSSTRVGYSLRIIKISVTILFVLMVVAGALLTMLFYFLPPSDNPFGTTATDLRGSAVLFANPHHNAERALRYGFFHAISALNNAGFDIMGGQSIAPYYHEYSIQIVFLALFVIGGIGYPVIYDLYGFAVAKSRRQIYRWSLFTKLSMVTYVVVGLIGVGLVFTIEAATTNAPVYNSEGALVGTRYSFWNSPLYGSKDKKTMALIFNTLSTRNAGFSTIRMGDLSAPSLLTYSSMMFLGAAPSSTGGGIRTTTFALMILGVWRFIRGNDEVRAFNRRVPPDTVTRSLVVFFTAVVIWAIGTFGNYISFASVGGEVNSLNRTFKAFAVDLNGNPTFISTPFVLNTLAFEAASAFGTTGLSIGLTPYLSTASKIILIFIMFIGQLGVSNSLFIFHNRASKSRLYRFVEEDVAIG